MLNVVTTEAERTFVEDFALSMERMGLYRMAGRIIGWLIIADPPEQSAGDIADALQASKASISGAMKFLLPTGIVERFSRPGERRDLYRVPAGVWVRLTRAQTTHYQEFRDLTERGIALLADQPPRRRERLEELHDLFGWLNKEFPALLERWEQQRG
jgi:DNA-binding transcriptional regulator GbsR (MarR family)